MSEREEFEKWWEVQVNSGGISKYDKHEHQATWDDACKYQQQRIDELVKFSSDLVAENAGYKNKNDFLQTMLNIAVEAMENLVKVKGRHNTEIAYKRIEEALNQINKLKGE